MHKVRFGPIDLTLDKMSFFSNFIQIDLQQCTISYVHVCATLKAYGVSIVLIVIKMTIRYHYRVELMPFFLVRVHAMYNKLLLLIT